MTILSSKIVRFELGDPDLVYTWDILVVAYKVGIASNHIRLIVSLKYQY